VKVNLEHVFGNVGILNHAFGNVGSLNHDNYGLKLPLKLLL